MSGASAAAVEGWALTACAGAAAAGRHTDARREPAARCLCVFVGGRGFVCTTWVWLCVWFAVRLGGVMMVCWVAAVERRTAHESGADRNTMRFA